MLRHHYNYYIYIRNTMLMISKTLTVLNVPECIQYFTYSVFYIVLLNFCRRASVMTICKKNLTKFTGISIKDE